MKSIRFENMLLKLAFFLALHVLVSSTSTCKISKSLRTEIQSYKDVIQKIKSAVVDANGPFKNFTWNVLAEFVDKFGSRLAGTENLERSIDFLLDQLNNTFKLENVHGEEAQVPHWVR